MGLLLEVADSLRDISMESIVLVATGAIMEGRGAATCLALGGSGRCGKGGENS